MSNRKSKPELRVIEDEGSDEEEIVRLVKRDGEADQVESRATPTEAAAEVHHLDKPEEKLRPPEPGMDALMQPHANLADDLDPENDWSSPQRKRAVPYGWFALILLLLGTMIFLASRRSADISQMETTTKSVIGRLEEDQQDTFEAEKVLQKVEQTARRYLSARTIEQMLPQVRDRQRVEPLMRDYYRSRDLPNREFSRIVRFHPTIVKGELFYLIQAEVVGQEKVQSLILEERDDGTFGVDWETDVRYQPMPWDDYVQQRPEGGSLVFRVYAEIDKDGLFTHEFQDETQWLGFYLTAPDAEEFLIGYTRRDQPIAREMLHELKTNQSPRRAMCLRLSRPEGTRSPRGVIIEEIVSNQWLIQHAE